MTTNPVPKTESTGRASGGAGPITLTLPVAPRALARIRFAQLDLQARAVPPTGALTWLAENLRQGAPIGTVDLDGPGDPLAEIECTMATLELIRGKYPDLALSLTTLGLHGEKYAKSLAAAGVTSVTLLVDAVSRPVAEKLYAWIRPERKTVPLAQAGTMLIDEQSLAVQAFKAAGCRVRVRSTVYPGINDGHLEEIARVMAGLGVEAMTLAPCKTMADQEEQLLSPPDRATMLRLQKKGAKHLATLLTAEKDPRLGVDCPSPGGAIRSMATLPKPGKSRPNVAVVSGNGMEIDLHLGQAHRVLIYGPREDGLVCLLATRPVPEPGSGSSRWAELAASLSDCFVLLTASAGESPRRILAGHGIPVLITDNEIEGTVEVLFNGPGKKKKCS
jgi:nitrogen fixation protein NifB